MPGQTFKISKVTLALSNVNEMVNFYRNALKVELGPFEAMGTKLYSGSFAGMNILLCPNSLAGVDAKQNRHQFDIEVNDLDSLVKDSLASGGNLQGEVVEDGNGKSATIVDPDGNTMNFIQRL